MFLAGLFGTVIIFFFVCYAMGKVINNLLVKQDGAGRPSGRSQPEQCSRGQGRGPDQQRGRSSSKQLQQMTSNFPAPRLDIDDGNQATADLHAREDLLLEHYSTVDGQPGTIRIPIERAMELIAQNPPRAAGRETAPRLAPDNVAHAATPEIHAPLTTGFARTGYELTTIEAREQRMDYGKAGRGGKPQK